MVKTVEQNLDRLKGLENFTAGIPATDSQIAGIERELNVVLPEGYRAFLRRYGFAIWFPDSINGVFERDEERFPGYDFDVVRETKEVRRRKLPRKAAPFPNDAVVLADDQSGGYFVLFSMNSATPGRVVWYDYDAFGGPSDKWKSFEAYLDWLVSKPPAE
jgi:hypothetical protein